MQLNKARIQNTTIVHLKAPSGVEGFSEGELLYEGDVPVAFELVGYHTDKFQAEVQRQDKLKEQAEKEKRSFTPAESRRFAAEQLAACVVGWTGITGEDGQPLECNKINVIAQLQPEESAWVRAQLNHGMALFAKSMLP